MDLNDIKKALKEIGYEFLEAVEDESFDYPLDFVKRLSDGAEILADFSELLDENGEYMLFELRPYELLKQWQIEDDKDLAKFKVEFPIVFTEFWNEIGPNEFQPQMY